MKLTKTKLQQIIKEEIENLNCGGWPHSRLVRWGNVRDELAKRLGSRWTPEDEKLLDRAEETGEDIGHGMNQPDFKARSWYPLFVKIVNKKHDDCSEKVTGLVPGIRKQPQKFKQTRFVPKTGM